MNELPTDSKAVIETRLVHAMQRRATSLLADAATRPSVPTTALAELRDFLVPILHHHHEREDQQLWPLITATAPQLVGPFDELAHQHGQLESALAALDAAVIEDDDRSALIGAAVTVRDLVHRHLEREEPLLLPALRDHVSEAAWEEFSRQAIATAPTEGTHLVVGFLDRVGPPHEVELLLASLPDPARELVPAMREKADATLGALEAATGGYSPMRSWLAGS